MIADADGRNPLDLFTEDNTSLLSILLFNKMDMHRTSSIKQTERVWIFPNHDCYGIVIEHLGMRRLQHRSEQRVWLLTVGTYSLGNLFVVYDMSRHVCRRV